MYIPKIKKDNVSDFLDTNFGAFVKVTVIIVGSIVVADRSFN